MTARGRAIAGLLALLALPSAARGDGGAVVLREDRGPVIATLLAGPVPLRAGPVQLEVLVQSRATGAPLPDANATVRLTGPGAAAPIEVCPRAGDGGNRLLLGARVDLREAGPWAVELVVTGAGVDERFDARLDLAPPRPRARRYWPIVAAGPAGLALLALHQALALRRRPLPEVVRGRSPGTRRATPARPRGRP